MAATGRSQVLLDCAAAQGQPAPGGLSATGPVLRSAKPGSPDHRARLKAKALQPSPEINPSALICDISGQDGLHLAQLPASKGYRVIGTARVARMSCLDNLERLGSPNPAQVVSMAFNGFRSVLQVLSRHQPAEVHNRAGRGSVGLSFKRSVETIESISIGTLNRLESTRISHADPSLALTALGWQAQTRMTDVERRTAVLGVPV